MMPLPIRKLSTGTPEPAVEQPKRAKLLVPGSAPVPEVIKDPTPTQPVKTAAAPKPLAPPEGSKPSVHTTAQIVHASRTAPVEVSPAVTEKAEGITTNDESASSETPTPKITVATKSAPTLVRAKATAQSIVKPPASTQPVKPGVNKTEPLAPAVAAVATAKAAKPQKVTPVPANKPGMPPGVKVVLAVVVGLLAVMFAVLLLKKSGNNAETRLYNEMITYAQKGDATELPVDSKRLDILLRNAVSVASNQDRYAVYKALFLAKSTDGTDIDGKIVEFATTREMISDIRIVLIRDVLRKRKNPEVIRPLIAYARSTNDTNAAIASLEAVRFMATEEHFPEFIEIIQTTQNDAIRKAAESSADRIIDKTVSKDSLGAIVSAAYDNAFNDVVRHTMLRLLAGIGGEKSLALAKENLQSSETQNQIAAIVALGNWKDQSGFKALIEFIASSPELSLRKRAYDSAITYASESTENLEENWNLIAEQAKTNDEHVKLVRGVATSRAEPWAFAILQGVAENSDDDKAIDLAERAIVHLKDVQKTQPKKKSSAEDDEEEE